MTFVQGVIHVDAVSLSCFAKALGEAAGMTFPKKNIIVWNHTKQDLNISSRADTF